MTLSHVSVSDVLGNSHYYGSDELDDVGLTNTDFEVINSIPDFQGPVLTSYESEVIQLNVSESDKTFEFSASFIDNLSGLDNSQIYFSWDSPSGQQNVATFLEFEDGSYRYGGDSRWVEFSKESNEIHLDKYEIFVPQYSEIGTWTLGHVSIYDSAGNRSIYEYDDFILHA